MSQHRPKPPLDTLQSMINAIANQQLIETGKALRAANKERGRPQPSSTRLRSSMPAAIEHFHQALDDLETDIVRPSAGTDSADLTIDLFGDLSGNNNADADLNFDMDFFNDTNTHDNSQTQHTDFDFSIGNNTSQDFSMPDLQTSHEPAKTNSNSIDIQDDLFGLDTTAGGDLMDLEAAGPAHESAFDDMFIDATQTEYDDDFFFGNK
ncbi:hypothetical protein B0O99DRAFT_503351 [Bisporella sp. PMI_857]|nr:hypothetical protein B0O99DRAFT_504380 [Bisporella sp. PMI_857]KAH8600447.1 hypothetical protein B0O99DRAFT_503351 [Bisporella sp. PMI_857]